MRRTSAVAVAASVAWACAREPAPPPGEHSCALVAGGGARAGSFLPLLVLVLLAVGRRRLA